MLARHLEIRNVRGVHGSLWLYDTRIPVNWPFQAGYGYGQARLRAVPDILPQSRAKIVLAFACVYFFWGSTYTAIRVAGEHLSPPLVAATRSLISTALLVGICLLRGQSLRVSRAKAWRLALIGVLFMTCNNVLLTWAETMVPSGLASLVVSTMPIMVALLEAALGGEALNRRGWVGTLLGTVGMAALVWPSLGHRTGSYGIFPFVVLFCCVLPFAVGSVLSRRFDFQAHRHAGGGDVATRCGGRCEYFCWRRAQDRCTARSGACAPALGAIVYLSVFGSLVGYSCYTYLLKSCYSGDEGFDGARVRQSDRGCAAGSFFCCRSGWGRARSSGWW